MHDPMTVAFDVPSYKARCRWPWLPHIVTIWHKDPEKGGSDDSCGHRYRSKKSTPETDAVAEAIWDLETVLDNQPHWNKDGGTKEHKLFQKLKAAWHRHRDRKSFWRIRPRWHVWHWRLQVHPLQMLRRVAFTRCESCGGHFKRSDSAVGGCWNDPPRRWFEWFRSERYLRHMDCARVEFNRVANVTASPPGTR